MMPFLWDPPYVGFNLTIVHYGSLRTWKLDVICSHSGENVCESPRQNTWPWLSSINGSWYFSKVIYPSWFTLLQWLNKDDIVVGSTYSALAPLFYADKQQFSSSGMSVIRREAILVAFKASKVSREIFP